jgi:multiple sugar transport system permease protein
VTVSIRHDAPSAGSDAGRGRAPDPGPRASRLWQRVRKGGLPYLFLLPALLLELLIHFIPMIFGILISFKQLTLFFIRNWQGAPWAGWSNYHVAVDFHAAIGSALLHSFWVTCAFTVLAVGLSWLFGTVAAILTQDTFRGRAVLRTIFLTPFALPVYASVIVWAFMFQYNNGLVNQLLHNTLGITSKPSFWLIGHNSFFALVIISIWRNWPFAFLCVMAGLQGIPRDLYEASAIDGAGIWQQIRKITMPSLRAVNQVLILVLFLWTFNDFTTPFVLFGSSAPSPADVISIHIYQASFVTWNFGEGSAMSVLMLLFLLVVTAAYLLVTRRRASEAQ